MGKHFAFGPNKLYDTYEEALAAEDRWKQNELLNEQNELLKENELINKKKRIEELESQEEIIDEQKYNYELNIDSEKEFEIERQKHDKEMRLYKICDDIGISKTIIDDYEKALKCSKEERELSKKIDEINEEIFKLEEKITNVTIDNFNKTRELKHSSTELQLNAYNKMREMNSEPAIYYDKTLASLFETKSTITSGIIINGIGIGISLFLNHVLSESNLNEIIIIIILVLFYNLMKMIYRIARYFQIKNQIIEKCDESIRELNIKLKKGQQVKGETHSNLMEIKKIREEKLNLVDKRDKLIKNKEKVEKENIKNNLDDLYQFRINHYNNDIEKVLIDFEFDKKYKGYYKKIITEEANGKGTVSNFNDYFLKKSNKYINE